MRQVATCGIRLDAAKLVVDQLESINDVAIKTGFSKSAIDNWARHYREAGKNHPIFGWGEERYSEIKRIHKKKSSPQAVTTDLSDDLSLSEILNQLGSDVNRLQHTVFELQTRFEQAFKMIK